MRWLIKSVSLDFSGFGATRLRTDKGAGNDGEVTGAVRRSVGVIAAASRTMVKYAAALDSEPAFYFNSIAKFEPASAPAIE